MSSNNQHVCHDGKTEHVVPPAAVEVNIHNILNPYCILVSNIKESARMLKVINEKLPKIVKQTRDCEQYKHEEPLKPETMVIVHRKTASGLDLPAWYSRGIIISYNKEKSEYLTFLVDYGEYMNLSRESFITVTSDATNKPFVTYHIIMDEILPVKKVKVAKKEKIQIVLDKEWSVQAIDLTMQLVRSSTKSYFHHITYHHGIKCGELYLIIDNYVVPLRQALIRAHCAVFLTDNLFTNQITSESSSPPDTNEISDESSAVDYSMNESISKAKRNVFHEILVSSNVECKRLSNIAEAPFKKHVLEGLKELSITHVRRLQSYIWPAINKGLDVLAIGPHKCGKTIGYATPIASIIADTRKCQVEYHPMALILCSSSSQVMYVQSIFKILLAQYKEINIIAASNGCTDRSLMASIITGCHIFISTPAFLVRFFERDEHHRKYLKLVHISHLVIDDLDILLKKHSSALTQLLGRYTLVGKKYLQHTNMLALQLVAAVQQWSPIVGKFTKVLNNPYICIGSFADAAIFCGIKLRPHLVQQDKKKEKIAEILCDHYRMVKTMIVCANTDEADELNEYLADKFKVLYVHKKMLYPELLDVKDVWDVSISGMYKVMICVDDILSSLNITDVGWLIHYSVAVPSKQSFLFRFSTLMSNLKRKSNKVEVAILIDNTNDQQFRGIMDMVKRSGITIPPKLLNAIEQVSVTLERNKKGYPICNNIKSFGFCPRSGRCNYRHCVLADIDTPMTPLVIGNRFKFTITYVHNATHFSARINEYIDVNKEKHVLSEVDHIKITSKVHHYYSDENNRCRSRDIIVGGIYAYDDYFDTYQRVQVIDIVSKDGDNAPLYVNVRCIDSGILSNRVRTTKLLHMPEELAKAPAHVVELFLADLLPYDNESEWNRSANECTHKWFSDQLQTEGAFLQGKVCLHLGNTIWVNPIEVCTKVPGYRELIIESLTSHLIKQKYGIMNRDHMASLNELCVNGGIIDTPKLDG